MAQTAATTSYAYARKCLAVSLFATALGVAANIQYPAIAPAAPDGGVWDIERFEDCLKKYNPASAETEEEADSMIKWCCDDSGGVWNAATKTCTAPPLAGQQANQIPPELSGESPAVAPPPPTPPRQVPGGLTTDGPAVSPEEPTCQPFPACTRTGG